MSAVTGAGRRPHRLRLLPFVAKLRDVGLIGLMGRLQNAVGLRLGGLGLLQVRRDLSRLYTDEALQRLVKGHVQVHLLFAGAFGHGAMIAPGSHQSQRGRFVVKVTVHQEPLSGTKRITGIVSGGAADGGDSVRFILALDGGNSVDLHCPFGLMAKFVTTLQAFAQMTAAFRKGRPLNNLNDVVHPFTSTGIPRLGRSSSSELMVEFSTKEGIPVMVAMPQGQAQAFAERILAELGKAPPKLPVQ